MPFSPVAEYFYSRASSIPSDAEVYSLLAAGDVMQAFEQAEEVLRSHRHGGTETDIAAAMITSAEVSLACQDAEQAHELAESALSTAKRVGDEQLQVAAMNVLAKVQATWNPAEGLVTAKAAKETAKATGNLHLRACVQHTVASVFLENGQGREAIVTARDMEDLGMEADAIGLGCTVLCISEIELAAGQHKAAVSSAQRAIQILESAGNATKYALAVQRAASAAFYLDETTDEGFLLADQALTLYERSGETKGQALLKIDMAKAKLKKEAYVEAEDLAEDVQKLCKDTGDLAHEAKAAQLLATIRLAIAVAEAEGQDDADTSSATSAARDALMLFRKLGDRHGEASAMHKLAQVRYHSGATDMAKMAADEAQAMFMRLGDQLGEAGAVLTVAHVLHSEAQFDSAKRNAIRARSLYESVKDAEGADSCRQFLEKVEASQSKKSREVKAKVQTVSETGLVKLVNTAEEATHVLSFLADMDDEEDTELSEFDLSQWGKSTLKIKA